MENKVNILVVDDRAEGLLAVSAVLDSPEYNLVTASSGMDALKHLLHDDFAVILLDVQMPLMNGFETAEIIKTREKSKDIPIVFMSAINQDEQYVYQGYKAGAVDYLLKPFDPYILKSKVSIFVDLFLKKQIIKDQTKKLYESEIQSHIAALTTLENKSLKRYQHLADSIPQIVFRLDSKGNYEYFNKVWFEFTGLSLQNTFGPQWKEVIHPDDLNHLTSLFNKAKEKNEIEGEGRILNKNGEFRWHLFRIHAEVEHGEILSWLGTATDIEDRKKMEDGQKFLARAGEALVKTLDHSIMLKNIAQISVPYIADWCAFDFINDDGKLENYLTYHRNPGKEERVKKIHDLQLNHALSGNHILEAIEKKSVKIVERPAQKLLEFNDLGKEEYDLSQELNETTIMIIPIVAHGYTLGSLTFASYESGTKFEKNLIMIGEELGRRVALAFENSKLYQLSQKSIEIRNDFLSIASHELNTPITSLKLQMQMVRRNLQDNKESAQFEKFSNSVDNSLKQVERLINLVQVLLDVSHIQSGKLSFTFMEANVRDMINELVDRHKEMLEKNNCTLTLVNEHNLSAVWDKTRIEQVITNLLSNSVKYAPGKINLEVEGRDKEIVISVRDFGKGIPQNKLVSIFNRFERINTNEGISGLGLGLFIVKQIVEGHNGKIDISSEIDKGTCFTVHLPLDARTLH
jgi:PAS domain S-box-containing protein